MKKHENMTWMELIETPEWNYCDITLADVIPLIPENLRDKLIRIEVAGSTYIIYFDELYLKYDDIYIKEKDDPVSKELKSIAMNSFVDNVYISYKNDRFPINNKQDIIVIDLHLDVDKLPVIKDIYFSILYDDALTSFTVFWPCPKGYDELTLKIDTKMFITLYKKDKTLFHNELYKYLKSSLGDKGEKLISSMDISESHKSIFIK